MRTSYPVEVTALLAVTARPTAAGAGEGGAPAGGRAEGRAAGADWSDPGGGSQLVCSRCGAARLKMQVRLGAISGAPQREPNGAT